MSSEANKGVVGRFYDAFNRHDLAALDEIVADAYVDHNPGPGQAPGREGLKQVFSLFQAAFPDLHIVVDNLVAEGERVISRQTASGTHSGEFLGLLPTGKHVKFIAMDEHRVANGRIVETWHLEDLLGLMYQLGAMPALEPRGL